MDNQNLSANQADEAKKSESLSWPQDETIQFSVKEEDKSGAGDEKKDEENDFKESILSGINPEAMTEALRDISKEDGLNFFSPERGSVAVQPQERGEEAEIIILETESQGDSEAESNREEVVEISKNKLDIIKKLFNNIKENSRVLSELLSSNLVEEPAGISVDQFSSLGDEIDIGGQIGNKVIEGVFNGQHMIGPDGKQYNISSNYASKSKLVEGDILKLTINSAGKFIYKQIGPIERGRIVGKLVLGKNLEYFVESEGRRWHVLTASVTYFKGNPDDEVIILVPKHGESNWAAVENIINES
ncbi:hypothetical protein COT99_03225 [Candidatus Falkowbacteria bacterium CG10_big_fil_rev_8_21_14_0_10_43_10]|uniref:50S ribosomal protein L7/L12 n=1 Tax=Candidatus Falkowbacteria bacterium CG10_big_fil_rev_8_21_14_0_10_43_10 TaxID=1974567 RepID=A0A2H0V1R4_9BACT|nr:MAG: hypothetical protein COT99_03225 [Candidatus Falkowbacteria bacterium CG10_big_fil_rev_8_21_14_0_10_43_10]